MAVFGLIVGSTVYEINYIGPIVGNIGVDLRGEEFPLNEEGKEVVLDLLGGVLHD